MWWHSKKDQVTLVTHDGSFHADEVMATAILQLVLEADNKEAQVVRTYDPEQIAKAAIVYDVGAEYNPATKRFDHHQPGGAETRENGIEYASAGLIWRHYGHQLVEDEDDFERIDARIMQPLDAIDNGQDLVTPLFPGVYPYSLSSVIGAMNPNSQEDRPEDEAFFEAVSWARKILERELVQVALAREISEAIEQAYHEQPLIVLDTPYARYEVQSALIPEDVPEALYIVFPSRSGNKWRLVAIAKSSDTRRERKPLPASWHGLRDTELQLVTGVDDAIFCHRTGFMAAAESKEGALKLAELALSAT